MYYVKAASQKEQIIDLSVKHQILSKFTAFICTEKVLVDGRYEEVKQTGQVKVEMGDVKPKVEDPPSLLTQL